MSLPVSVHVSTYLSMEYKGVTDQHLLSGHLMRALVLLENSTKLFCMMHAAASSLLAKVMTAKPSCTL